MPERHEYTTAVPLTQREIDAVLKTLAHVKRTGMGKVEFDARLLDSAQRKLRQANKGEDS